MRTTLALLAVLSVAAPVAAQGASPAAARIAAASRAFGAARSGFQAGTTQLDEVYVWSIRWLESERASSPSRAPAATRAHLDRMLALQADVRSRVAAGLATPAAEAACEYYVAEARVWAAASP
jgi:hypothetical protein